MISPYADLMTGAQADSSVTHYESPTTAYDTTTYCGLVPGGDTADAMCAGLNHTPWLCPVAIVNCFCFGVAAGTETRLSMMSRFCGVWTP